MSDKGESSMKMPKRFQRKAPHRSALVGALFCASALTLALPSASLPEAHGSVARTPRHHGLIPPANPRANIPMEPSYGGLQASSCTPSNSVPDFSSKACLAYQVAAISHARSLEHVGPLRLPQNWGALTPAEQLFVVIDSERVARGLQPFDGLSASLDAVAQQGVHPSGDPVGYWGDPSLPSNFGFGPRTGLAWACTAASSGSTSCTGIGGPGSSVATGGSIGPLAADYEWMYNDGWGGSKASTWNLTCTSSHASACWGHRDNILGPYPTATRFVTSTPYSPLVTFPAPVHTTLLMGAAVFLLPADYGGSSNVAAIFLAMTGRVPKLVYTWADASAAMARGRRKGR